QRTAALDSWCGANRREFRREPEMLDCGCDATGGPGAIVHRDRPGIDGGRFGVGFVVCPGRAIRFCRAVVRRPRAGRRAGLFGNLTAVSAEARTDTFIVPWRRFPTATKITIR